MLCTRRERVGESVRSVCKLDSMGRKGRRARRLAKAIFRTVGSARHRTAAQTRWPRIHRPSPAIGVTDVTLPLLIGVPRARDGDNRGARHMRHAMQGGLNPQAFRCRNRAWPHGQKFFRQVFPAL